MILSMPSPAFPKVRYNGTMDFVCQLETGEYALVETQVYPQNYWDERALAYVAAFYGNQLRRGDSWRELNKVIGINILAGERRNHWPDTPDQYMRHYKMQEQMHTPSRYIDGIELIQYSLANAPETLDSKERQDWVTFFRRAHLMSTAEVDMLITTPEVRKAFEMIRLTNLSEEVREAYVAEGREYDRFSKYTDEERELGKKEGRELGKKEGREVERLAIASALKLQGWSEEKIAELLRKTPETVSESKSSDGERN